MMAFSSEEKKQIVFIVNPLSHEIKGLDFPSLVEKNLSLSQFEYRIVYSEYSRHATKLAKQALHSADIIVAVGGDGVVNEVGRALINTDTTLGIIPVGSGNGLARHFGIPTGLTLAIQTLNEAHPMVIDTGKVNDEIFLGTAGIGFDAYVAHHFAQFGKRGFLSYCQVVMQQYARYHSTMYSLVIDGKEITRKAFILTFANASQYGNRFIIAPKADVSDGLLDLSIVDDIPLYSIPQFLFQFRNGKLHRSHHFETHQFKEIILRHPIIQAHLDGEPLQFQDVITVTVQPKSLKILIPATPHP